MKRIESINVIPFIDILLVFLAIVLTTASFISQGKIKVNLPEANNETSSNVEQPLTLTVSKSGQYFLKEEQVSSQQVESLFSQLGQSKPILLKIDKTSDFEHFVNILDISERYQLKNISIATLNNT